MNKRFDFEGTLANLSKIRVKLYNKVVAIVRGSKDLSITDINSRNGSG